MADDGDDFDALGAALPSVENVQRLTRRQQRVAVRPDPVVGPDPVDDRVEVETENWQLAYRRPVTRSVLRITEAEFLVFFQQVSLRQRFVTSETELQSSGVTRVTSDSQSTVVTTVTTSVATSVSDDQRSERDFDAATGTQWSEVSDLESLRHVGHQSIVSTEITETDSAASKSLSVSDDQRSERDFDAATGTQWSEVSDLESLRHVGHQSIVSTEITETDSAELSSREERLRLDVRDADAVTLAGAEIGSVHSIEDKNAVVGGQSDPNFSALEYRVGEQAREDAHVVYDVPDVDSSGATSITVITEVRGQQVYNVEDAQALRGPDGTVVRFGSSDAVIHRESDEADQWLDQSNAASVGDDRQKSQLDSTAAVESSATVLEELAADVDRLDDAATSSSDVSYARESREDIRRVTESEEQSAESVSDSLRITDRDDGRIESSDVTYIKDEGSSSPSTTDVASDERSSIEHRVGGGSGDNDPLSAESRSLQSVVTHVTQHDDDALASIERTDSVSNIENRETHLMTNSRSFVTADSSSEKFETDKLWASMRRPYDPKAGLELRDDRDAASSSYPPSEWSVRSEIGSEADWKLGEIADVDDRSSVTSDNETSSSVAGKSTDDRRVRDADASLASADGSLKRVGKTKGPTSPVDDDLRLDNITSPRRKFAFSSFDIDIGDKTAAGDDDVDSNVAKQQEEAGVPSTDSQFSAQRRDDEDTVTSLTVRENDAWAAGDEVAADGSARSPDGKEVGCEQIQKSKLTVFEITADSFALSL
jgi:hypothetical protein